MEGAAGVINSRRLVEFKLEDLTTAPLLEAYISSAPAEGDVRRRLQFETLAALPRSGSQLKRQLGFSNICTPVGVGVETQKYMYSTLVPSLASLPCMQGPTHHFLPLAATDRTRADCVFSGWPSSYRPRINLPCVAPRAACRCRSPLPLPSHLLVALAD